MFALGDLLGPGRCAGCRRSGTMLCARCRSTLRPAAEVQAPRGVDRALAAWEYEGAARSLVLGLKVGGLAAAAQPMADALVGLVRAHGTDARALAWVPGRAADVRRRGFDHAEVIARALAGRTGLPARGLLARTGHAGHLDQAGLSRARRFANLSGAFRADSCGGVLIVVDDLITTGATARSCAAALRAGGASRVEVVAVCHTAARG
ncbi:MAG: ComF family protein [Actinomycetota bacterium]